MPPLTVWNTLVWLIEKKKQLSLFSLLNIHIFSLHHFFIPSKHFLPSVESCACYLVVSILDKLFLEILACMDLQFHITATN